METETVPIEAANRAAWEGVPPPGSTPEVDAEIESDTRAWAERMREARAEANPEPTVRLQCPTLEHGEGVLLYVAGASGYCHCGRTLRTLAPGELLARVNGRVVPVEVKLR